MKSRVLIAALVAAGVIGAGSAVVNGQLEAPFTQAHANPLVAAGVAAPAANPSATALPLTGFTELVKSYGPAVVNVSVNGTRKASAAMPQVPEEFREFFRGFGNPVPRGDVPMRGQGSGFIVSRDGYILTNAHVVESAETVTIKLNDRREFRAKVIGTDKQTDVAVLKIEAENLPTVRLGTSRAANVGEWVVAIGSPFGFENSVSAGIVSAKARSLPDATYVPFIQTDVAVNPGNSGGPLFNLAGEVIGINSQIYSRTGGYQGISFAIPIEVALNVKDQIVQHGKVSRGKIGVTVQEVNATLADSFGLDRPRGALVAAVEPSSPADKGGLKVGDIILSYEGKPIERSSDLPMLVADTAPGKAASMEVWRKGGKATVSVAPDAGKPEQVAEKDESANSGRLGLAVRPLSPEERSRNDGQAGLLVEQAAGPAARAGVRPGDVVLSFNGTPLTSVDQLREHVAKGGKRIALLIQRDSQQLFVPIELG